MEQVYGGDVSSGSEEGNYLKLEPGNFIITFQIFILQKEKVQYTGWIEILLFKSWGMILRII